MNTKVRVTDELKKIQEEAGFVDAVKLFLSEDAMREGELISRLASNKNKCDELLWDELDETRLFHIDAIRKLAIDYRLKFLPSAQFKGEIPYEALHEVKNQEALHQTEFTNMYVLAPRKYFNLQDCDGDPLLFTRVGENHYYLLAQWGGDMHRLRKWLVWPVKNARNAVWSILIFALILNVLTPDSWLAKRVSEDLYMYRIIWFIQCLFILVALSVFYMFGFHRNLSEKEWNSKYFNV